MVPEPGWFDLQEARFDTVLYQCNSVLDAWTERCLRQADRVVVLGLAKHPMPVSAAERYWADLPKQPSRNMLVLLGSGKRRGTSRWLEGRQSVGVHHLDWGQEPGRIARFLDGTAVGLVLGSLAGYYLGWIDQLLSRAVDGWLSLPGAVHQRSSASALSLT